MGYGNPYYDVPGTPTYSSDSQYSTIGMTKNFKDAKQGDPTFDLASNQNTRRHPKMDRQYKKNGLRRQRYRG